MQHLFSYTPGQLCTIFLETKNIDGYFADGYYEDGYNIDGYNFPVVQELYNPDFSLDGYYPQPMTKLETGIYVYQLIIPSGSVAVGNYLAKIAFRDPDTYALKFELYNINVNAPFGLYSVRAS